MKPVVHSNHKSSRYQKGLAYCSPPPQSPRVPGALLVSQNNEGGCVHRDLSGASHQTNEGEGSTGMIIRHVNLKHSQSLPRSPKKDVSAQPGLLAFDNTSAIISYLFLRFQYERDDVDGDS
jgi:hypothetical protein